MALVGLHSHYAQTGILAYSNLTSQGYLMGDFWAQIASEAGKSVFRGLAHQKNRIKYGDAQAAVIKRQKYLKRRRRDRMGAIFAFGFLGFVFGFSLGTLQGFDPPRIVTGLLFGSFLGWVFYLLWMKLCDISNPYR